MLLEVPVKGEVTGSAVGPARRLTVAGGVALLIGVSE
jgi:hypothetical protein